MTTRENQPSVAASQALEAWIEAHRGVFGIMLDGYVIVDTANRVVDCNEAFATLTGHSTRRLTRLKGGLCEAMRFNDCPGDCPTVKVLGEGTPLRLDEVPATTAAHESLTLILSAIPILAPDGAVLGAMMTTRDVTAEVELLTKYDVKRKESIIDGLTGVFNRMYIDSQLEMAVRTYFRQLHQFTLVMADIDHFKRINDTYGHQAGDAVLKHFAGVLQSVCRDTDLIGRYGGEEFMILLPKCAPAGAQVFCERLRAKTAETGVDFDGRRISMTVSLGAASFDTTWPYIREVQAYCRDLTRRADQSLYRAKHEGRNRVIIWEYTDMAPQSSADVPPAGVQTLKKSS